MPTIVLFSASKQSHCRSVACHVTQWVTVAIHWLFLNIHWPVVTVLFGCYMAGPMWNCCHLSARSVYTIQPCTSLQCHFIQSHMCRGHVCLAVTCHLHFWQNDRDHFCSAVVMLSKWVEWIPKISQHRKLTLEEKNPPLLLPGLRPVTFQPQVLYSTIELSPLPHDEILLKCFITADYFTSELQASSLLNTCRPGF